MPEAGDRRRGLNEPSPAAPAFVKFLPYSSPNALFTACT